MKLRVILIALLLFAPLAPSISAAPPKAGAICSKSGLAKNYNGKRYTCIKSGKKLVWNKGVVIKVAAPTPSATLSPSPTITSSPTSTPTPTPTSPPSPTPTTIQSFADRWRSTGSVALKVLESAFPAKVASFPKVELIWHYSDTVDTKIKEEITKQYQNNSEFWSAYTKIDGPLQVIVGTLDDIAFVCKWRDFHLQMNAQNCVNSFRTDKNRVWDAHTTQLRGKATDFYFMTSPESLTDIDFLPRVAHEFFHNVQHSATNNYKNLFPCWAEESGAEHFGILVTSNGDPEKYLKLRYFAVVMKSNNFRSSITGPAYWKDWLTKTEVTSYLPNSDAWGCQPYQNMGLYGNGLLATEYLNLQLGIPGVMALYRDAGTMGWEKAMEKAFNKPKISIYEDMAAYMHKEFTIASNQDWARPNCVPRGYSINCSAGL